MISNVIDGWLMEGVREGEERGEVEGARDGGKREKAQGVHQETHTTDRSFTTETYRVCAVLRKLFGSYQNLLLVKRVSPCHMSTFFTFPCCLHSLCKSLSYICKPSLKKTKVEEYQLILISSGKETQPMQTFRREFLSSWLLFSFFESVVTKDL